MSGKELVSEAVEPLGSGDAGPMGRGEPGLPGGFRWRDREYRVARVLARGRETGPCSGETYVRRHTFKLAMDDGSTWEVYIPRQPPFHWYLKSRSSG